jgi:prevent-host-death family protein
MATIPQKELRNNVAGVLRRAEAGEQFTITVSGRPVAELGPTHGRRWMAPEALVDLWGTEPVPGLMADLAGLGTEVGDPWSD